MMTVGSIGIADIGVNLLEKRLFNDVEGSPFNIGPTSVTCYKVRETSEGTIPLATASTSATASIAGDRGRDLSFSS